MPIDEDGFSSQIFHKEKQIYLLHKLAICTKLICETMW